MMQVVLSTLGSVATGWIGRLPSMEWMATAAVLLVGLGLCLKQR
jgi:hypothetical protein